MRGTVNQRALRQIGKVVLCCMISLTQPVNQCPIKNSILFVDSYGSHNSLLFIAIYMLLSSNYDNNYCFVEKLKHCFEYHARLFLFLIGSKIPNNKEKERSE
jgi:hypothetical protein